MRIRLTQNALEKSKERKEERRKRDLTGSG